MKTTKLLALTLTTLLLAVLGGYPAAEAYVWPPHCPVTSSLVLLSTAVLQFEGGCSQGLPLALGRISQSYPAMGGATYTVDYWQGSYVRSAMVQDSYRQDFYDSCTGIFEYSNFITDAPHEESASFDVENPNLSDDVSTSFEANAPMTDQEAQAALQDAERRCESAAAPTAASQF